MSKVALVLGGGRSGCAAARLLRSEGYQVTLLDEGDQMDQNVVSDLAGHDILVLLQQSVLPSATFDVIVVSPGLADTHPLVVEAKAQCDDVISELELGYRYCQCPLLAVTGTNGKSTLTRLLDDILRQAGLRSASGGNLGVPLCELVPQSSRLDWIVVEVSSFQLELVRTFRPHGAILLNLQPDHLDRHGTMEGYLATKCRIFTKMEDGDYAIVQDQLHEGVLKICNDIQVSGKVQWILLGKNGWHYREDTHAIYGKYSGQSISIPVHGSYFDNAVTGETAAAAAALSMACCEVVPEDVGAAIQAFQSLPHRMQVVEEKDGILFVDDSKATNLAAMHAAVSMQQRPIRLIAGGLAKENDVGWVKQVLKNRVACAYLIGSSAALLEQAWSDTISVKRCGSLGVAMESILRDVQDGEVVLLSPGCASFDQFRSYAERGEEFARLVQEWCGYK